MSTTPFVRSSLLLFLFTSLSLGLTTDVSAYVNQSDGTVVPVSGRLQMCLDRPVSGDGPGVLDETADARVLPEAYRPVLNSAGTHYRGTFVDIAEGAGFRNSFGWYWVGTDVSNPANLFTIFGCRTTAQCDCPCATTRTVNVDFETMPGFAVGRPIGLWLRTPERLDATRENGTYDTSLAYCTANVGCNPTTANLNDSCGGRLDTGNRIYFTSSALNDDGDFVHFLVYASQTFTNTYYFGFEDLFRGGDNDYEDMLVRGTGLVPLCVPGPETCNNGDDDCDGRVDELLTMACSTACGAGTRACTAGTFGACSARVPSTESCNNVDDNCNGNTDEGLSRACSNTCGSGTEICIAGTYAGCTAPSPTLESCNAGDDDCDGRVDELLTRTCATACGAGTQTCSAGSFGTCSARLPSAETCDGTDQDCDTRIDEGLVRDCSNSCGSGFEVCRVGVFGECSAPASGVEACNGLDDDCDGNVDEGITRACSTACGVGSERCEGGSFIGCDAPLPSVEACNNRDDDCDGVIDDGNPGGGAACLPFTDGGFGPGTDLDAGAPTDGSVVCGNGNVRCIAGALVCQGATTTSREICNCLDDDCDGNIDEEADGALCPGGACIASECTCREACMDSEFPCPIGTLCDTSLAEPPDVVGYCVEGPCNGVVCSSDEEVCDPDTGLCANLCDDITCTPGFVCVRGGCTEDNCFGRGCPTPGDRCVLSAGGTPRCEANPCTGVTCREEEFCRDGECETACTSPCRHGTECIDGACVLDACGGCDVANSCVDGECTLDSCAPRCGRARVCVGSSCISDPCTGVTCPSGTSCSNGACTSGTATEPARRGLATGGACTCSAAGSSRSGSPFLAVGGLLLLLGLGMRRRVIRAPAVALSLAIGAAALGGCAVEPYCFENCGDDDLIDGGGIDTERDAPRSNTDGCVTSGEERCDAVDNDCDGLTDEDFDLERDPRNCGSCANVCNVPNAYPACTLGECDIDRCAIGFTDRDGVIINGCEYRCLATGDEVCDVVDNDCDGTVDEGFDLNTEVGNCGRCGNVCAIPNADSTCTGGVCTASGCRAGYVDLNGLPDDGCEYNCTRSGSGTERCNGVDDDCDRNIDEGFNLSTDVANCGTCGVACAFANAIPRCGSGVCTFNPATDCMPGFVDADHDPRTGCEYSCVPTGGVDDCDRIDDDCDGRVDEADPMAGTACGVSTGSCDPGIRACVVGVLTCLGGTSPLTELCNSADDDCDSRTDETPLPGVGDRCGASNVGRCAYGNTVCSAGGISCSGAVGPIAETCNGIDDNCNGATDDGVPVPSAASVPTCAETRGVCVGRVPTCRGSMGFRCDLPVSYQATETRCDGLDNDCDGTADENCLVPFGATDLRVDLGDTATSANSLDPFILGDGGNRIWVTWTDLRPVTSPVRAQVFFNRSTTASPAFLASAVRLNRTNGGTFPAQLAFSNTDDVVAVYPDFRGGAGYREIYGAYSASYGTTFANDVKVNGSGTSATRDSYNIDVASAGNNVYAVYESFLDTRVRHAWFVRSTDGGNTWQAPIQLSASASPTFVASTPRVAATGSNVYVVWRDNRSGSLDLYLRRSTNSGSSFAAETRIDVGDAVGSHSSFSPELACEGANVYVAWVDDRVAGSFDIHFNDSNDSGATWRASALSLDADAFAHDSIEPFVTAPAAGVVLVSWLDYRSGFPDPFVIRSTNAGTSFGAPERLDTSTTPGASGSYDLAFGSNGNLVAAAWADDRNGLLDIYANFSLDGGVTWQPSDYRLDTSVAGRSDSQRPSLYVSTSAFHVVWEDHRRGAGCATGVGTDPECPAADIYYRVVR